MGGGSIDASACVALAVKSGGGGGGGKTRPCEPRAGPGPELAAGPRAGGGGGGGRGGDGVAELLTGNEAFRDVPHV